MALLHIRRQPRGGEFARPTASVIVGQRREQRTGNDGLGLRRDHRSSRPCPHPEDGWYRETFRDSPSGGGRGALTQIYYLLREGERSRWHRVDAVEVWHFYAGEPLMLHIAADGDAARTVVLGSGFADGQIAHAVVPAGAWRAAEPLGAFTLVGCTVAPAFQFEGFELAPEGWQP